MNVFLALLVKGLTSEAAKALIIVLFKKLIEHKTDGVTKEVAEAALEAIGESTANNAPKDSVDAVKILL